MTSNFEIISDLPCDHHKYMVECTNFECMRQVRQVVIDLSAIERERAEQEMSEMRKVAQHLADGEDTETIEMVDHPAHYNSHPSGVEAIDIIRHMTFNSGSAVKYLWRAGLKDNHQGSDVDNELQDLNKAMWYIRDEIQRLEVLREDKRLGNV